MLIKIEEKRHRCLLTADLSIISSIVPCVHRAFTECFRSAELVLLLWGVRLCYVVRKAPSEFNESRFISWAIYNETMLSLFLCVAT